MNVLEFELPENVRLGKITGLKTGEPKREVFTQRLLDVGECMDMICTDLGTDDIRIIEAAKELVTTSEVQNGINEKYVLCQKQENGEFMQITLWHETGATNEG